MKQTLRLKCLQTSLNFDEILNCIQLISLLEMIGIKQKRFL